MTGSSPEFDPWPTIQELLGRDEDSDKNTTRYQGDAVDLERLVRVLGGMNLDPEVDGREHVFEASTLLAQVAIQRPKDDDESWDDVVQVIEEESRPSLAAALWVGLSEQPVARYPSLAHWQRSLTAGLRSDTAVTTSQQPRQRPKSLMAVGVLAVLMAAGAVAWFGFLSDSPLDDRTETAPDVAAPTAEPTSGQSATESATDGDGENSTTDSQGNDSSADTSADDTADDNTEGSSTDSSTDKAEGSASDSQANDDPCRVVGPLGELFVDQVTDVAIVVGWDPSPEAISIQLDGGFVDTVPPDTNQYVIEHRPLLPPPLPSDTEFVIEISTEDNKASAVCAITNEEASNEDRGLIGVYAPTGLEIIDQNTTSLTVRWDQRPGADLHHLYLDRSYVSYGDGLGSTSIGDENEFTLFDLQPGTTYEIGIRRVEGFNQSGMAIITATTPSG